MAGRCIRFPVADRIKFGCRPCFSLTILSADVQFQRVNSYDRVRKIVQEEGRAARNLITWSVPAASHHERTGRTKTRQLRKPLVSSQRQSPSTPTKSSSKLDHKEDLHSSKGSDLKSPKSEGPKIKVDLRARYWAFLFDNLKRAVDAIYQTCEEDESVVECKEVIMVLDQSTKDFRSLIERLHILRAFEDATREGDRPTSIAWEVRKMSPGKNTTHCPIIQEHTSPSRAQRILNFNTSPSLPTDQAKGNSWADRVKGTCNSCQSTSVPQTQSPSTTQPANKSMAVNQTQFLNKTEPPIASSHSEEEEEGWETVQRGGKGRPRSTTSKNTSSNNKTNSVSEKVTGNDKSKKPPSVGNGAHINAPAQTVSSGYLKSDSGVESRSCSSRSHPQLVRESSKDDSEKENKPLDSSFSGEFDDDLATRLNAADVYSDEECRNIIEPLQSKLDDDDDDDDDGQRCLKKIASPAYGSDNEVGDFQTGNDREGSYLEHVNGSAEGFDIEYDQELCTDLQLAQLLQEEQEEDEPDEVDDRLTQHAEQLDIALASAEDEEDSLTQKLELEQDKAIQKAIAEEETWLEEIAREKNTDIEMEPESESDLATSQTTINSLDTSTPSVDWDTMMANYDADAENRHNTSWGDMVEMDESGRTPGHGVHMHEKLSSPSRKRSPTESKKRHEAKQAKAQVLREKLLSEKAERLRDLSKKVEEVQAWKDELLRQRKLTIQMKMQRAEEKRQSQLKLKAQKAHEEEAKVNEIAFINTLEAQNKRHDIMSKHQESDARLQDIQEERQRRLEEKQAKEAAVEERRKALEAERKAKLNEMQERRRQRDARVEQQQQEREKERLEMLRVKEKEKADRLAALNAQQRAHIEELQKKIQQKQDETHRRHVEMLEGVQRKAFEMSVLHHSTEDHNDAPQLIPYDQKKVCTVCNVLITSEVYLLSHLRGKKHRQALEDSNSGNSLSKHEIETFNLKNIVDAPDNSNHPKLVNEKERQKALRKRCKKLRQRMSSRGQEYENSISGKQSPIESTHRAKLQKIVKDINKYLQCQDKGPWPQNKVSALDRALGEIVRILDKKVPTDQISFCRHGGLTSLCRVLMVSDTSSPSTAPLIPAKSLSLACTAFRLGCKGCYDNCHYMLFSNKVGTLIDVLIHQLNLMLPESNGNVRMRTSSDGLTVTTELPFDPVASSLLFTLTTVLSCLAKNNPTLNCSEAAAERTSNSGDAFMSRGNDVISYIISVGIVDKLSQYFSSVHGPVNRTGDAEFLQHSLALLVAITKFTSKRSSNPFEQKKEDPTQLINTFEVTDLVGIVSLLYGMLLHSGAPARGEGATPPDLPPHTIAVITTGLRMFNHMAMLDLSMLQKTLGEEGLSLEFRHISSYLIWFCSHQTSTDELLHEVILCVGYFTVRNPDNQVIVQSGQPPTVLQQLCALPFQYFSDPRLTAVLFPSLISCCYNNQPNKEILEQELSSVLLANFIEEKQLELQQAKLLPSATRKDKEKVRDQGDVRMLLSTRFPMDQWEVAQTYFKSSDL